uniref:Capsid protein VP2 n=1 Tax=Recovirus sp. TaxID=2219046 RepID=A0A2Z4BUH4_9CALI|nr:MAG: capsid protein VP2 [Recovirus sp.]
MAGAAFATGLGQAAGGIFGSLIQGAIQAGLNEQNFQHNKFLAQQQHGYDLDLQAKQFGHNVNMLNLQNSLKLSNFTNAGFSQADAALLARGASIGAPITTARTPTGTKLYARGASNSHLTYDPLLYQGFSNMVGAAVSKFSQKKEPQTYNWQINPLNYDTLSNWDTASVSNLSLSSLNSTGSSTSSLSLPSNNSIGSWGSYMDRHFPLE